MSSNDSTVFNPGMIRDDPDGCLNASVYTGHTAPGDNRTFLFPPPMPASGRATSMSMFRAGYVGGQRSSVHRSWRRRLHRFLNEKQFFTVLDNLIQQHRVPPMVAISIGAGGQDAQGSERGLEYDAVSGAYAEFVENEVLPLAEKPRERQADQEPGRPRDDGHQLERRGGLHDGLVPSRALPPRARLFADGGEPAMAA